MQFNPSGHLQGISAEGKAERWPDESVVRTAAADPASLARLVREWTRDRPQQMKGIIWYRLPVSSDQMNWTPQTLATVMAGRAPLPRLTSAVRRVERGLYEIEIANVGEAEAAEVEVELTWRQAALVTADGLAGFERRLDSSTITSEAGTMRFHNSNIRQAGPLRPCDRPVVAWVRLDRDTEITTNVTTSKSRD